MARMKEKANVERETRLELATFCLGSSRQQALWHERAM